MAADAVVTDRATARMAGAGAILVSRRDRPMPVGEALARLAEAADQVARGEGPPQALLWRARRSLLATPAEARGSGFAAAARRMAREGWPVHLRHTGGGAFPLTPGTVQLTLLLPRDGPGQSLETLYARLAAPILDVLAGFGVAARIAPVPAAFCSGRHDIAVGDRKIGGMAQRWSGGGRGCVLAGAALIVDEDPGLLADAANRFYALAGTDRRCRPEALTSLAAQLAPPRPSLAVGVMERLERAVAGAGCPLP